MAKAHLRMTRREREKALEDEMEIGKMSEREAQEIVRMVESAWKIRLRPGRAQAVAGDALPL